LNHKHINEAALKESEYLYIEGYLVSSDSARHAAIECKKLAEANNVKTALTFSDPAMVQFFKDGLVEMLGTGVDLLFCNEDEAMGFTGCDNLQDAATEIKKIAKTFAITCGAKGAILFDGNNTIKIAPNAVKAIDSNGAGDNFAGAFLYALTAGHSWEEAGKLASKISAQVVSQFGPRLQAQQYPVLKDDVL
jgi:sugar/nucleoside kinase (ribokinase family)